MVQDLWQQFHDVFDLGRSASDVGYLAKVLRTVIVYLFVVAAIRVGSKRFLSKATPFDVVVAVMPGSMSNAAITGSALLPTLVGAVLVYAR